MKLRYIDALRGIAILMVIMVHTSMYSADKYPVLFKSIIGLGAKGVQLFFMASAFTLFLSHQYHVDNEKFFNRNFAVRRIFRIAPMYFLGILYFAWWNGFESNELLISNFLFIHGVSPYWINELVPGGWSITVEMSFYLIFPWLASRINSFEAALRYVVVTMFIAFILKVLFLKYPLINSEELWGQFLYYYFPNQLPIFCLGIAAYFLIVKHDFVIKQKSIIFLMGSLLSLLIIIGFINYNIPLPWHFVISLGFFGLIYTLSKKEFLIFVNRFTVFFGKISFSAYLIHFAVLSGIDRFNYIDFISIITPLDSIINYGIRLGLVLGITAVLASFFYNLIEMPFQKLGKEIIKKTEINRKCISS